MAKPLRITFLITDLYIGGSPRMLRDLAYGLAALNGGKDFQVTVISLKPLPAVLPSGPARLTAKILLIPATPSTPSRAMPGHFRPLDWSAPFEPQARMITFIPRLASAWLPIGR